MQGSPEGLAEIMELRPVADGQRKPARFGALADERDRIGEAFGRGAAEPFAFGRLDQLVPAHRLLERIVKRIADRRAGRMDLAEHRNAVHAGEAAADQRAAGTRKMKQDANDRTIRAHRLAIAHGFRRAPAIMSAETADRAVLQSG
jgi:hypothetical protein